MEKGPERGCGAGSFGLPPLPKALNPICFPPLYALLPPGALPRATAWHGGPCSPSHPPLCSRGTVTLLEIPPHRAPSIQDPSSSNPSPELVRGLWLLLPGTTNKDVRTRLFMGKAASSGLALSAAQAHVPGQPHSQSCSCN